MKKKTLLIILICIFTLTGCGKEKKVSCTMSKVDEVGYKLEAKVNGKIEDGNVTTTDLKMTMTFDDEKLAKNSYEIIKEKYEGENEVDIRIDKNVISVTEQKTQDANVTKQDFIDAYQEEGYTCE